jgi:DNA-binding response OmpR family regulator
MPGTTKQLEGDLGGAGQHILVIDDSATNLEVLRAYLSHQKYNVNTFLSGAAAFDYLNSDAPLPDVILLDIAMPGMTGFEFCKKLGKDSRLRAVPVIMVTAHSSIEDRIASYKIGVVDYILKPVDRYELLSKVKVSVELNSFRKNARTRSLQRVLAPFAPEGSPEQQASLPPPFTPKSTVGCPKCGHVFEP